MAILEPLAAANDNAWLEDALVISLGPCNRSPPSWIGKPIKCPKGLDGGSTQVLLQNLKTEVILHFINHQRSAWSYTCHTTSSTQVHWSMIPTCHFSFIPRCCGREKPGAIDPAYQSWRRGGSISGGFVGDFIPRTAARKRKNQSTLGFLLKKGVVCWKKILTAWWLLKKFFFDDRGRS